jgi:ubiquinone/menaquinone biosynthesis C-methylase UbiE
MMRINTRLILLFASITLAAPNLIAEEKLEEFKVDKAEEAKIPPGLTEYKGRKIAQTMHYTGAPWLVRESREREEDCSTLLKVLDVKPGQVICDMGSGNGYYTIKLAKLAGETGKIYAVEIQPEMLYLLRKHAAQEKVENIKLVLGTVADPKLPDGQMDMVLCVDVYHEFDHPIEMLAAIRKSLKPKGRMVLVEFRAEDPKVPIKPEHKMSKEQILKEILPNGFKLVDQFDKLPWQHVMFFERDDSVKVDK